MSFTIDLFEFAKHRYHWMTLILFCLSSFGVKVKKLVIFCCFFTESFLLQSFHFILKFTDAIVQGLSLPYHLFLAGTSLNIYICAGAVQMRCHFLKSHRCFLLKSKCANKLVHVAFKPLFVFKFIFERAIALRTIKGSFFRIIDCKS